MVIAAPVDSPASPDILVSVYLAIVVFLVGRVIVDTQAYLVIAAYLAIQVLVAGRVTQVYLASAA